MGRKGRGANTQGHYVFDSSRCGWVYNTACVGTLVLAWYVCVVTFLFLMITQNVSRLSTSYSRQMLYSRHSRQMSGKRSIDLGTTTMEFKVKTITSHSHTPHGILVHCVYPFHHEIKARTLSGISGGSSLSIQPREICMPISHRETRFASITLGCCKME